LSLYSCTVWNDDYSFGDECAPPELVGGTTVFARSDRKAAGRAYVHLVGQKRVERLIEMNAPKVIIDFEQDPIAIAGCMGRRSIGPTGEPCYTFDNLVEKWHIAVKQIGTSIQCSFYHAMRSASRHLRRRPVPSWVYRSLQFPSRN
jgi:hypothetical protein